MGAFILNVVLLLSVEVIVIGGVVLIKYSNVIHKRTLIIIALALSIITMCVNPTKYWDLYRQYAALNEIKNSGIDFIDLLFNNKLRIGGTDYVQLFFYNIIRYLVVILKNNRMLPFIMTFITYGIWCYITIDWNKEHYMSGNDIVISMMLCNVFMPFIFVNSGLRNTTAAAILALAIYNNMIKKHSFIEFVILFFFAFTVHFSVIYVVIIYLLSKMRHTKLAVVLLFFGTNIIPYIAGTFRNSKYEILSKMSSSFAIYTEKRSSGINYYLIGAYIVLIGIMISLLIEKKNNIENSKEIVAVQSFLIMMVISSVFNLGYLEMILRPLYVLGVLSTPVLYSVCGNDKRINTWRQLVMVLSIVCGLIFVLRISLPEYMMITYC
ncbi:EpsG family protein [Dorea sp.]